MKIKKIEALLKKSKRIQLVVVEGNRWIGNGQALYLINDLPQMTKKEILSLYDVPEEKHNEYIFEVLEEIPGISFKDIEKQELGLTYCNYSICFAGKLYQALSELNNGVHFIKAEYLKPFTDKNENYSIYQRFSPNGDTYFAIKKGLLLVGIVKEHYFYGNDFVKWVNDLAKQTKNNKADKENDQISLFQEDEEK